MSAHLCFKKWYCLLIQVQGSTKNVQVPGTGPHWYFGDLFYLTIYSIEPALMLGPWIYLFQSVTGYKPVFFSLSAFIEKKLRTKTLWFFFNFILIFFVAIFIERRAISTARGYVQYRPQALKRSLVAAWPKKHFPGLESNYFQFVTGKKLFFSFALTKNSVKPIPGLHGWSGWISFQQKS